MGGADFVQWHGFYEMNVKLVELKKQAEELRNGEAAPAAKARASDDRAREANPCHVRAG